MTLILPDGRQFTNGVCSYRYRPATESEESLRIVLPVEVEGQETEAVLDTGGIYFICTPDVSELLGVDRSLGLESASINIRGVRISGMLHRVQLSLLDDEEQDCVVDVTAFVPDLNQGDIWGDLPAFLGLQGCLELIRFAVDPGAERFYFGPIPWDDL